MTEFSALLKDFISHTISDDDFVNNFLAFRRRVQDESWLPPDIRENLVKLNKSVILKQITLGEFKQEYLDIVKYELNEFLVKPFSTEGKIIDELFYKVDAFCGDAELFEEGDIGEDELRQAAKEAFVKLSELD